MHAAIPRSLSVAPQASPGLKLALALSLSLLFHLVLLFFVHLGAIERGGVPPRPMLVARLVASPSKTQAPLLKAIDHPPPSHIPDYQPPKPAADAPSKATPDTDATPAKAGMSPAAAGPMQIDAPIAAEPTYYSLKEVDEHPRQLGSPLYPERAAEMNIPGSVKVRLLLNEHGGVDEAEVLAVKPAGFGFKEAVLAYLKTARFTPAMIKGRAVKSTVNYELEFKVQDVPPE